MPEDDLLRAFASRINKDNNKASRWGLNLNGSLGYSENRLPIGIEKTGLNMGGRAGVRFPLGNLDAGLGVSGSFGKNTMDFPNELIQKGAPEYINNIYKQLTGVDASLNFPGGERLSADWSRKPDPYVPGSDERKAMLKLMLPLN